MDFAAFILNELLDAYERSGHCRGDISVNRRVAFKFTEDVLPRYFDDTTAKYKKEINEACGELQKSGLITVQWLKHEKGNIIDRVYLSLERLDEAYKAAGRQPKAYREQAALELIAAQRLDEPEWLSAFYDFIADRIKAKKSPLYINIGDIAEAGNIFKALNAMAHLQQETPRRVFSVRALGNSKAFEAIEGKLSRILLDFCPDVKGMDKKEALAEMNVVDNPQHIYLSGPIVLQTGKGAVDVSAFWPDIGLPSDMIDSLVIADISADYVITVENLTTYYEYAKSHSDGLIIYLGGYHNQLRRRFLKALYAYIAEHSLDIPFYHWGDIDYGGFAILSHLRRRCGIPFLPYRMDVKTLENFADKTARIDDAYKKRLALLLDDPYCSDCRNAITYMMERGVRLEQEAIAPAQEGGPLALDRRRSP